MSITIYVLKLESNKYYVGRTNDLEARIEEHFDNEGSLWTSLYSPIKMIAHFDDCDNFDEDKYTIKYMAKYGIDNVRGGSFVQEKLTKETIEVIEKMINNATNKCFNCGGKDHYIADCDKKTSNRDKNILPPRQGDPLVTSITRGRGGPVVTRVPYARPTRLILINKPSASHRPCNHCKQFTPTDKDMRIHEKICLWKMNGSDITKLGCCPYCRLSTNRADKCFCPRIIKCWHCSQDGHIVLDCPQLNF